MLLEAMQETEEAEVGWEMAQVATQEPRPSAGPQAPAAAPWKEEGVLGCQLWILPEAGNQDFCMPLVGSKFNKQNKQNTMWAKTAPPAAWILPEAKASDSCLPGLAGPLSILSSSPARLPTAPQRLSVDSAQASSLEPRNPAQPQSPCSHSLTLPPSTGQLPQGHLLPGLSLFRVLHREFQPSFQAAMQTPAVAQAQHFPVYLSFF